MNLTIRPMQQADAERIARWHYEGPYAFYDMANDPDDLAELMDPQRRENVYFAAVDADGSLIGFFCFSQDGSTVELGLGLRPDLTGKGLGLSFLEAGLQFARERFSVRAFRLSVAAFNQRAIKVYAKAGFKPGRTYKNHTNGGVYDFLEMTREA
jgi:ribosomal-protein-alanine N-acetyltransferase